MADCHPHLGGDSQQIGGVRKTTDFLDKSTWVLASLLLILILLSNITLDRNNENIDSKLLDSNNLETAIPEAFLMKFLWKFQFRNNFSQTKCQLVTEKNNL